MVSDIYLKTARKQEKKSRETKISKRQHEVEETHPVQQARDVYYEYRSNGSLDLWQKIEGICPTDLLSFVVGDILKISKYYSEPGTSKLIYDKFKLRITNFDFSNNFYDSIPIEFEDYGNHVERADIPIVPALFLGEKSAVTLSGAGVKRMHTRTRISRLSDNTYFEVIVDVQS